MAESVRDSSSIDQTQFNTEKCNLCGGTETLKVCARCKSVAYCSREHQTSDWPKHRKVCKGLMSAKSNDTEKMGLVTDRVKCLALDNQLANVTSTKINKNDSVKKKENNIKRKPVKSTREGESIVDPDQLDQLCMNKNQETYDEQQDVTSSISEDKEEMGGSSEKFILESEETELKEAFDSQGMKPDSTSIEDNGNMYMDILQSRNVALSEYVTKCLNSYGVCVIDNFLGEAKGTDIWQEVKVLYAQGELKSGQLINANSTKGQVRGDVISWVDGSEKGCENISTLISSIDAIMLRCRKALDHYFVKGRSKAMVAAYPGNGTGFLRHVDNPSGDGRCVTCIYYLNKDWNSTTDGGLLRIFPEGQNRVANVEPKFDRLLFFWSDRRNPHEVLPAYKTRFAVTVWFYDQDERRRAVKKFKGGKSLAENP